MLKAFLRFYPRRMLAHGSRYYSYLVLRDNEIHVLLSRTAKRIHLKVIIPQECAAEECGANFYTVTFFKVRYLCCPSFLNVGSYTTL